MNSSEYEKMKRSILKVAKLEMNTKYKHNDREYLDDPSGEAILDVTIHDERDGTKSKGSIKVLGEKTVIEKYDYTERDHLDYYNNNEPTYVKTIRIPTNRLKFSLEVSKIEYIDPAHYVAIIRYDVFIYNSVEERKKEMQ